jgi:hypothetical protein
VKVWLATVAMLVATSVLLVVLAFHATPADGAGLSGAGGAAFVVAALAFATVGALIRSRVPGNRIGPLFCLMGAMLAAGDLTFQWADLALFVHDRPGGAAAAWLEDVLVPPAFGLLAVAVLLFPHGRPPSRRWRWALWVAYAGIVLNLVGYACRPGPLDPPFETVDNPFGIPGLLEPMDAIAALGWLLMGVAVALAAVASRQRLRRAHGVERVQLKWLALAGVVTGTAIALDVLSYFVPVSPLTDLRVIVLPLGFTVFPLTAGAAILRHRLYDIDVVINRALVYGGLTATLGAAYLGLVLLIGLAVGRSNLAIAVSTLAVAALFRPARARIQDAVDRRFYRRRYDAQRTLEAFGVHLRDEVEVERVAAHLHAAVRDTVQPAHLTLWLPAERP